MKKDSKNGKALFVRVWQAKYLYLCILPIMAWILIFQYGPMYGLLMAFKDYKAKLGILRSPWAGLENFKLIFKVPIAREAIINTLRISVGRLIFVFPIGIVIAILLTEMRGAKLKKICQTVLTFPHFLSWVVVACILKNFLSTEGVVNSLLGGLGMDSVNFLGSENFFRPLLYITENWKEMGWSAIIYIAAIAGIDPTLYEAAEIDGASRLRRIWHITLVGIRPTIAIMFILAVGNVMNAGFDQIFNMRNGLVEDAARILDTYVYDITFARVPDYGFSTAVGLFKSVVNLLLLLIANKMTFFITGDKMLS
ncbi:MAG: sugar ABC transporter permease [Roseburia sp.]|nr:sugar ABC transporter permease [Roseburia sp.]